MAKDILTTLPIWEQFQKAARERHRNPLRLLTAYMQERLEIWEDQQLDEDIRHDMQRNKSREEEAVEIVRQHRREKRERRAAS